MKILERQHADSLHMYTECTNWTKSNSEKGRSKKGKIESACLGLHAQFLFWKLVSSDHQHKVCDCVHPSFLQ